MLLLKEEMGLRMKHSLGGEVTKNQYMWGNFLKKRDWTVCRFKGGLAKKRRMGDFWWGRG